MSGSVRTEDAIARKVGSQEDGGRRYDPVYRARGPRAHPLKRLSCDE
jgi:hypothetical protein